MARLEMTEEQFQAALAAAAKGAAEAAVAQMRAAAPDAPPQTGPISVEEFPGQYASVLKKMRERPSEPQPEPVACISPITGSSFRARCRPDGRVLELLDYKEPEGIDKHVSEGGLVPDGAPIKDQNGRLDADYKQWRWTEFWFADLKAWIGKKMPAGMAVQSEAKAAE